MIIKNITIQNWGRYPSIDIPMLVDKKRNVVLIRARNNNGKTTLFYALKWGLFGEKGLATHEKQIEAISWINRQAAAEGDGLMFVEITMDIDGKEYRLQRSQEFYQTNTGDDIKKNGEEKLEIFDQQYGETVADAGDTNRKKQNWIHLKIIPESVSQFFFFDGEDIKRYTDKPESAILEAIVSVLGVKILQNSTVDVKDMQRIFTEDHRRKINKLTKDNKLKQESQDNQDTIEKLNGELEILIREKEEKIKRKKDLTDKLRKNENSEEKINERTRIEEANDILTKSLKINNDKMKELRGDSSVMMLSGLMKLIDKTEETPSSKDQWSSKVASYMIMKGYEQCVCDTHIDKNVLAILQQKVVQLSPTPQAQLKRFVESSLGRTNPDVLFTELNHTMQERLRIQNEMDQNSTIINRINDELKGFSGKDEIVRLRGKEEKIEKEITESIDTIFLKTKVLADLKNNQTMLTNKLETSMPQEEIDEAHKLKRFNEDISSAFEKSINTFYEDRKPKLEKHISDVFLKLINNPKLYLGLVISNTWEISVRYYDGKLLPSTMYGPSAGASQIVATAFIAGLNEFTTKTSPVIIDTPLGRLDDIHRENILKYYNKMSKSQVIILYTPTEITKEDQMLLEDKVKHHYEIIPVDGKPDLSRLVNYENVNR